MVVNQEVAKALYDNDISINSDWTYTEYIKDVQFHPKDLYPSHKKGEIKLDKNWGYTAYWKKCNEDSEYYIQYSAPDVMDVIQFFLLNGFHLNVVYTKHIPHFMWEIKDLLFEEKNEVGVTEFVYPEKNIVEMYELTLQDGLMNCIRHFLRRQNDKKNISRE